ncbi:MAG: phage regulatory CII family protein, partial [Candidatus Eremiobacterota bacterium]
AKGVKAVASELKLSPSLVYKWCQPKEEAGADNPLDRLHAVVKVTGDTGPIHWLCQAANGFFVENPVQARSGGQPLLQATQKLLAEFSDLLRAVSEVYGDDNAVDSKEAERIRGEWEQLKTLAEHFVVACERGVYRE